MKGGKGNEGFGQPGRKGIQGIPGLDGRDGLPGLKGLLTILDTIHMHLAFGILLIFILSIFIQQTDIGLMNNCPARMHKGIMHVLCRLCFHQP